MSKNAFIRLEERGAAPGSKPLGALNYDESGRIVGKLDIVANHVELVILVFVILILGGLVTLLVMSGITFSHIDTTYDATKCPNDGPCSAGVVTGTAADRYCEQRNRPADWKCNSNCNLPGTAATCNGKGACKGDWRDCATYCAYDPAADLYDVGGAGHPLCNSTLFPLKPYILDPIYIDDELYNGVTTYCFAQMCFSELVQLQFASTYGHDPFASPSTVNDPFLSGNNWYDVAATHLTCADMIDTVQTTVDTSCIVAKDLTLGAESTLLQKNWQDFLILNNGVTYFSRFCEFRYVCSQVNQTTFSDPINIAAKRGIGQQALSVGTASLTNVRRLMARTVATPEFKVFAKKHNVRVK